MSCIASISGSFCNLGVATLPYETFLSILEDRHCKTSKDCLAEGGQCRWISCQSLLAWKLGV